MEETQKDPNPSLSGHAGTGSQSTSQDVHMEDASGNHSNFSNNAATTGSGDNSVSNHSSSGGNKGASTDEGNPPINDQQRIVEEFQYLLEKSQQMFAGLR